jgi:hypothetical protein
LDGLPEWTDWGGLLTDGVKFFVVGLVYALPIILLSLCLGLPAGLLAEESPDLGSLLSVLLSCISILWAIVMSIVLPAAIAFWVANDDLGAAFRFGQVLSFTRQNLSTYLVTFIMSWVASFIGGLGSVVCGIGILATLPYSYMVMGHLYGQAYMAGAGQVQVPEYEEFA